MTKKENFSSNASKVSNLAWQWLGLVRYDVALSYTLIGLDQTHLPLLHRQPKMVWQPCNPYYRKVFQMRPALSIFHKDEIIKQYKHKRTEKKKKSLLQLTRSWNFSYSIHVNHRPLILNFSVFAKRTQHECTCSHATSYSPWLFKAKASEKALTSECQGTFSIVNFDVADLQGIAMIRDD